MKRFSLSSLSAVATIAMGGAVFAFTLRPVAAPVAAQDSNPKVARGAYLVTIMGCNDCHTPWKMGPQGPEPDMTRMLSGHPQDLKMSPVTLERGPWGWVGAATNTAFSGAWGVSFTANLTPDAETGLGKWTQETFIRTIRTGRHEGQGRPILPPMPYTQYRNATDEDLSAIFSFLQSIPAVRNRVPQPINPPESE